MNKTNLILSGMLFASLSINTASAVVFSRARGEFSTLFRDLRYNPDPACSKPTKPFTEDRFTREMYLRSARTYIDCLGEAAKADQDYAAEVINDGYKNAADEFLSEVKRGF